MKKLMVIIGLGIALATYWGYRHESALRAATGRQSHQLTAPERIAEIDRLLKAGPTGQPGDANTRVALRSERTRLGGGPTQTTTTRVETPKPARSIQASPIVVAHNSEASTDADWESAKKTSHINVNGEFHPNGRIYDNLGHCLNCPKP
jgi:hypothetical protein